MHKYTIRYTINIYINILKDIHKMYNIIPIYIIQILLIVIFIFC